MNTWGTHRTTAERAKQHGALFPLLVDMHKEFQELSKKKQDGKLGEVKIKMVNRLLENAYKILDDEPTRGFLDMIDVDDIPQNSDVVLILGQAVAAMKAFQDKYFGWNGLDHTWAVV